MLELGDCFELAKITGSRRRRARGEHRSGRERDSVGNYFSPEHFRLVSKRNRDEHELFPRCWPSRKFERKELYEKSSSEISWIR